MPVDTVKPLLTLAAFTRQRDPTVNTKTRETASTHTGSDANASVGFKVHSQGRHQVQQKRPWKALTRFLWYRLVVDDYCQRYRHLDPVQMSEQMWPAGDMDFDEAALTLTTLTLFDDGNPDAMARSQRFAPLTDCRVSRLTRWNGIGDHQLSYRPRLPTQAGAGLTHSNQKLSRRHPEIRTYRQTAAPSHPEKSKMRRIPAARCLNGQPRILGGGCSR